MGGSIHNVDFSGGTSATSCTQTTGPNTGPVPPLPALPTGEGWSGTCRSNTPRQRGTVVRGSVTTPASQSRIVATAFVSNRALAARRPIARPASARRVAEQAFDRYG